jgi:hypothetical protein
MSLPSHVGDGAADATLAVELDSRVSYVSSIARRQWGSASTLQTEVGTEDSVGGVAVAAKSCRQSTGMVTPATRRVTIRCVLWGSRATTTGW